VARVIWPSVILVVVAGSEARAVVHVLILDPVDDSSLVAAVSGQKSVKEFAAEIDVFRRTLTAGKKGRIEALLGQPARRPDGDYAMPVAQPRGFLMSGVGHGDARDKDHTAFYPVGDFAGVEVWYGVDGETPAFAFLYFRVDKAFPRLREVKGAAGAPVAAPKQAPPPTRKHTIDQAHWDQLRGWMTKEHVAELFSAPAGDYAPGTEYLTRSWGRHGGGTGKAHETLEWRSEKVRIVVEFDAAGRFVGSEAFSPGRDPVTNVAERLNWDREKFDKLKKYVEERMAAK